MASYNGTIFNYVFYLLFCLLIYRGRDLFRSCQHFPIFRLFFLSFRLGQHCQGNLNQFGAMLQRTNIYLIRGIKVQKWLSNQLPIPANTNTNISYTCPSEVSWDETEFFTVN